MPLADAHRQAEDHRQIWNPGLDNDSLTLGQVYLSMPGDTPETVPWYVKLLENPASPLALAGAVDLMEHDCVHVLLGRGLLPQDEAFVLGFTMGSSDRCRGWQQGLFAFCARHLYQGKFRFSPSDCRLFAFAVEVGRQTGSAPLDRVPFRRLLDRPLGELRRQLGLRVDLLRLYYEIERSLWVGTPASARLLAA